MLEQAVSRSRGTEDGSEVPAVERGATPSDASPKDATTSAATGDDAEPAGDAPADWELLHRRFGGVVYSVPRRFGLSAEDCDDVYQATWLTAVSRSTAPTADGDAAVVRWLAAIAAWETRNLLRRRRMVVSEPELLEGIAADSQDIPERLALLVEQHRLVEAALAALPARDREILRDLFLSDEPLSYEEVARRLDLAIGSVGPLRLRAIERLRTELTRRGF